MAVRQTKKCSRTYSRLYCLFRLLGLDWRCKEANTRRRSKVTPSTRRSFSAAICWRDNVVCLAGFCRGHFRFAQIYFVLQEPKWEKCMKISPEKLVLLRKERGWSQEKLAAMSGISERT